MLSHRMWQCSVFGTRFGAFFRLSFRRRLIIGSNFIYTADARLFPYLQNIESIGDKELGSGGGGANLYRL